MGLWLDFIQIALALGLGWLGWVFFMLFRAAPMRRPAPRAPRPAARRASRPPL